MMGNRSPGDRYPLHTHKLVFNRILDLETQFDRFTYAFHQDIERFRLRVAAPQCRHRCDKIAVCVFFYHDTEFGCHRDYPLRNIEVVCGLLRVPKQLREDACSKLATIGTERNAGMNPVADRRDASLYTDAHPMRTDAVAKSSPSMTTFASKERNSPFTFVIIRCFTTMENPRACALRRRRGSFPRSENSCCRCGPLSAGRVSDPRAPSALTESQWELCRV